jgi:hypothetical protein
MRMIKVSQADEIIKDYCDSEQNNRDSKLTTLVESAFQVVYHRELADGSIGGNFRTFPLHQRP